MINGLGWTIDGRDETGDAIERQIATLDHPTRSHGGEE